MGIKIKFNFIAASIFMLLFASMNVLYSLTIKNVIDSVTNNLISVFFKFLIISLLLIILQLVLSIVSRYFSLKYVQLKLVNSKNYLYHNYLYSDISDKTPYDISMFSTNAELLYGNYYINKVLIVYYISQFIFSVIALIYLNWILFLVALFTSMLPIAVPFVLQNKMIKSVNNFTNKSANYLDYVSDTINGRFEIKSFNSQKLFCNQHEKLNNEIESKRAKNKLITYLSSMLSHTLSSITFTSIIGTSGYLVIKKIISFGSMYAAIQLLNSLVTPIVEISKVLGEIQSVKQLSKQYFNEFPKNDGNKKLIEFKSSIIIKDVSYRYNKEEKFIIKNYNLTIKKGEKYAIIGPSGCGKSTIAKMISGIIRDYEGEILIDGENIKNITSASYVEICKYIHQDPYIFNDTIEKNIKMGNERGDIFKIADSLNITNFIKDKGLSQIISNKDSVSGGQKQRLILTRALYSKPQILILDEPTANIDYDIAFDIIKYLASIVDLTLIVITHEHNPDLLNLFDKTISIEKEF